MQPQLVERFFGRAREELGDAERRILQDAHEHRIVSSNVHDEFQSGATTGQRLADAIARVGGS